MILVIDEDRDTADAVQQVLTELAGLHVDIAYSMIEARPLLNIKKYGAILVDYKIFRLDGDWEFFSKPNIIIMSGGRNLNTFSRVLKKPFNIEHLIAMVTNLNPNLL